MRSGFRQWKVHMKAEAHHIQAPLVDAVQTVGGLVSTIDLMLSAMCLRSIKCRNVCRGNAVCLCILSCVSFRSYVKFTAHCRLSRIYCLRRVRVDLYAKSCERSQTISPTCVQHTIISHQQPTVGQPLHSHHMLIK